MGPKLTIHIGMHKTGSTSIQRALVKHSDMLQSKGIHFFNISSDGQRLYHGNSDGWIYFEDGDIFKARIHDGLADQLKRAGDNVLISTEMFSWVFDPKVLLELRKKLNVFFETIFIVIFLRRQDRQIISHYQESGKSTQRPSIKFFGSGTRSLPTFQNHFDLYYDYYQKVSMWAEVFGKKNMVIRVFEPSLLSDGDAVSEFFKILKVEYSDKVEMLNRSVGFKMSKINHLMNQKNTRIFFRKIIASSIKDNNKMMPSREEAYSFYKRYRKSNKKLNEEFLINSSPSLFNEDFELYPSEPEDKWDEITANSAILDLLAAFEEVPLSKNSEIDLIRDAAVKMEALDMDMASSLMDIAYRLRPQGAGINKKQEEYSKMMRLKSENKVHYIFRLTAMRLNRLFNLLSNSVLRS